MLMQEVLKQYYFTEKQNGYLQSGYLQEVSLTRSGRYERLDCNLFMNTVIFILLNSLQAQNLVLDNAC